MENDPTPPEPLPVAHPRPSGSARIIVALVVLSTVSAAICVGVILWQRQQEGPDAAAQTAPEASASGQPKVVRAMVKLPEGQTKAVMRQRAAFDAPVVLLLPAGTAVEVTNSTTEKGQTWFRVRTIDFQPPASGWMHGNVLRFE